MNETETVVQVIEMAVRRLLERSVVSCKCLNINELGPWRPLHASRSGSQLRPNAS